MVEAVLLQSRQFVKCMESILVEEVFYLVTGVNPHYTTMPACMHAAYVCASMSHSMTDLMDAPIH